MGRTIISETNVANHFWAEAVNTTCYMKNQTSVRPILGKTHFKLLKNRKPNISYFHYFGCNCFILNTRDNLNNFDSKAQKCVMLGYSECSKGYIVYNIETRIAEESIHVKFADLEITYSDSEGKELEANESEGKDFETVQPEAVETQTPLRRQIQRSSHSE